MSDDNRSGLIAIEEHKGSVSMRWQGYVPPAYTEGGAVEPKDGDVWNIWESKTIG